MSSFQLLRNLIAMAAADNRLTKSEMELLADRCVRWGLSTSDFQAALDLALQGDLSVEIPAAADERELLLRELLHMMAADGHLDDREKRLFARAFALMELPDHRLDELIDQELSELGDE